MDDELKSVEPGHPIFDDGGGDGEIGKGDSIITVRNEALAACLLAVGVPLWNTKLVRPYLDVRSASGKRSIVYNFKPETSDGQDKTQSLVVAFSRDLKFIKANPQHPMTFAMCAVKNLQRLADHRASATPNAMFSCTASDGAEATLLVREGSKKFDAAIREGHKRL